MPVLAHHAGRAMLRLTIGKKIALAVIGIVMLCVGTMAWVTSQNIQRGFINYLNQAQTRDLAQLGALLEARYRTVGNFDWLRHNRQAMEKMLGEIRPGAQIASNALPAVPPERPRPPPPLREADDGDGDRPPPDRRPPEFGPEGRARPARRPPDRRPNDPLGFGPRLSILDADGLPLIGPPDPPPGITRPLAVDGRVIGTLSLAPFEAIAGANDAETAISFVREQIRDILAISALLVGVSVLLALLLARHLLRPVAALRSVTARIAKGQFEARAPVLNRDELSELAQHVNAMAQTLEQSERRRRQMLADISHELRTPLTVIRGEIEALLDGIRAASPAALESLHVEVLRLNKLVDDVHQLTLADGGDLHYQRQRLDLRALIQAVAQRHQPRAAGLGLTLFASLPPKPVMMVGDSGRLTQVLVNLLENSCRYTDAGGKIALSLTQRGGFAEICVEDSAPGVPPQAHAHLFERLYRVDPARSRESGGNGLGLAICKALVEAHQGRISAMPSALGGVKMLIRLPL
jgi:two-component system sensor histidine kinase BaeS